MKTKYFIGPSRTRLPFWWTGLCIFFLWFFKIDDLWWGVFATFAVIYWGMCIYAVFWHQVEIDINTKEGRTKLKELLENKE